MDLRRFFMVILPEILISRNKYRAVVHIDLSALNLSIFYLQSRNASVSANEIITAEYRTKTALSPFCGFPLREREIII